MGESTSQTTGFSKFKPTVEFLGGISILVVAMGLPATVYHYSSLHVPMALLSYRRMLEAGLLPAALVVSFLMYLFWVEQKATKGPESMIVGIADRADRPRIDYSLSIVAFPVIIPAALVLLGGLVTLYLWMTWGIGWVLVSPLGWLFPELDLSDRWTAFIGFSGVAIALATSLLRPRRNRRRKQATATSQDGESSSSAAESRSHLVSANVHPTRGLYKDFMTRSILPEKLKDAILGSLFFYLFLPPMLIFCLYSIKSGFRLLDLSWPMVFTDEFLVVSGVFMGVAYAHFMSAAAFAVLLASGSQKTNEAAMIGRRITYVIFVAACIALYCIYIYPNLPRSYGGGRPEIVDIVAEAKVIPEPLKPLFTISPSSTVYLKDVQLIDKTASEVVVCKSRDSDPRCFSLPNSSVVSMSWTYREE
jgi:hypothetical protein